MTKAGVESFAPTSKPDVLKLARLVEDALTGVLFIDDAQIITELIEKHWGEPARVEVRVSEIPKGVSSFARSILLADTDADAIVDVTTT